MSSTTLPNVGKMEYKQLTSFQKEMHLEILSNDNVESLYSYDFVKTAWTAPFIESIEKITSNDQSGSAEYMPNEAFDYLKAQYADLMTPFLKVKSKWKNNVQVSWCRNLFHNIIKSGSLYQDTDIIQSINVLFLDYKKQPNVRLGEGMRDLLENMIRNDEVLGQWRTDIPSYRIKCPLPFYNAEHISKAIPLFLKNSLSRFVFKFTFERNISKLVRMRVRKTVDDEWNDIPFNWDYLDIEKGQKLDFPRLWGRYSCIGDDEKEQRKKFPHTYYTSDMIIVPSDSTVRFGTPCTLPLQSIYPIEKIVVVAQNIDAAKLNNHSNYTTNTSDVKKGWNPIETISVKYGNSDRIPEMESFHFEEMEHYYTSRSAPMESGWNIISLSDRPYKLHPDVGVVFYKTNTKLIAKLNSTDPFDVLNNEENEREKEKDDENDEENIIIPAELDDNYKKKPVVWGPEFKVYVIMIIIRKITFEYNKKMIIHTDNLEVIDSVEKHFIGSSV